MQAEERLNIHDSVTPREQDEWKETILENGGEEETARK